MISLGKPRSASGETQRRDKVGKAGASTELWPGGDQSGSGSGCTFSCWLDTGENVFMCLGTCPGVYKVRTKVVSNASWWQRGSLWNYRSVWRRPKVQGVVSAVVRCRGRRWPQGRAGFRSAVLKWRCTNQTCLGREWWPGLSWTLNSYRSRINVVIFSLKHTRLMLSSFMRLSLFISLASFLQSFAYWIANSLGNTGLLFVWKVPTSHIFNTQIIL